MNRNKTILLSLILYLAVVVYIVGGIGIDKIGMVIWGILLLLPIAGVCYAAAYVLHLIFIKIQQLFKKDGRSLPIETKRTSEDILAFSLVLGSMVATTVMLAIQEKISDGQFLLWLLILFVSTVTIRFLVTQYEQKKHGEPPEATITKSHKPLGRIRRLQRAIITGAIIVIVLVLGSLLLI